MALTLDQAIALLTNDPSSYSTMESLRDLVSQIEVAVPGTVTLLYSGQDNAGVYASTIAETIADNDSNIRIIGNTDAARFLDLNFNPALEDVLATIFPNSSRSQPRQPDGDGVSAVAGAEDGIGGGAGTIASSGWRILLILLGAVWFPIRRQGSHRRAIHRFAIKGRATAARVCR